MWGPHLFFDKKVSPPNVTPSSELGFLEVSGNVFPIESITISVNQYKEPLFIIKGKPIKVKYPVKDRVVIKNSSMVYLWESGIDTVFDLTNIGNHSLAEITYTVNITQLGDRDQAALNQLAQMAR